MAQQTDKGMTPQEARALIESGYAWIRHDYLEDKTHWGGGLLLDVEGDYGIVKPGLRHRKTERIPLSAIKPWKSKNADRMQRDGVVLREEEMKYAIVDLEDSLVWAGSQMGFIKTMEHAIVYENTSKANMGIGGMKRSKRFAQLVDQERIEVVPLERAEALLAKWQPKEESKPKADTGLEPKPKAVHVNEAPKSKPKADLPKTGDSEIDEAMAEYRAAMNDLEEAQIMVMEARERADKAVARMGQLSTRRSEEAMVASA